MNSIVHFFQTLIAIVVWVFRGDDPKPRRKMPPVTIPGVLDLGIDRLVPSVRSEEAAQYWTAEVVKGTAVLKRWSEIGDDDRCQRGPGGLPLPRVTPMVPFQTRDEWSAAGKG